MKTNTYANRIMNKRFLFILIGILLCVFILTTVKAEAADNDKTMILPTGITGDTGAAFKGGTCPAPYTTVDNIDIENAFIGEGRESLFVAIPSGRYIEFSFPDYTNELKTGTLTIETTGADNATGQVIAVLNDNTEQILGSIRETQATQYTAFSLDQGCIYKLKAIKIKGTNNKGQYPGLDVVSVFIEPNNDVVTRRYIIGKDTWKFKNLGSGKLKYSDYCHMYGLAYSKLLYEKYDSFNSGMCFGYSILIPSVIENLTPFTTGVYDIHDYGFEDVKQDLIYAQMYQWSFPVAFAHRFNEGDLNKLCEAVRNEMYEQGDPVVISVWGGTHAVLATSIIKDTPEEVIIGVYDSNFPDNKYIYDDALSYYNQPIYISVRLYGKDGKYNRCEWGLSKEEGGELIETDNTGDITRSVNFFKDINLFSDKVYWADYGTFAMLRKPSGILDSKVETYKINTAEGQDTNNTNDCLYWAKVTDGEYSITDVKANDEIQVALDHKIISITPDTDSDISIKLSDEMEYAEVNISSSTTISAKCEYLEIQTDDKVSQTDVSMEGTNNVSLKINNDKIVSNGATAISAEQINGSFESNDAVLIGETVFNNSYDQIDPDIEYAVNVDSGEENPGDPAPQPSHTHEYGKWKTTKKATEIATGVKTRTCSVCGEAETQKIVRLKPTLKTVKILKPKAAKKSATIKWKKVTKKNLKKIKKIEIQYSTDKNFKKGVKKKYVSAMKTSYKVKGLKKGKKYYVRIRAYTKKNGVVHVSKWSSKKPFKAK